MLIPSEDSPCYPLCSGPAPLPYPLLWEAFLMTLQPTQTLLFLSFPSTYCLSSPLVHFAP